MTLPWWEFALRALLVFIFLLFILRLSGKRQTGQLAPFDLVLLLVLSNAVQNSMNGGDNSLIGGLISATTLVSLNYLAGLMTFKSRRIEKWIDGDFQILIKDGKCMKNVLIEERISMLELGSAIRQAGVLDIEDVKLATLEFNGSISVIPKDVSK